MKSYIFNCKSIGIALETRHGAYDRQFTKIIRAQSIEKAIAKIEKELQQNRQFRFEFSYLGYEETS